MPLSPLPSKVTTCCSSSICDGIPQFESGLGKVHSSEAFVLIVEYSLLSQGVAPDISCALALQATVLQLHVDNYPQLHPATMKYPGQSTLDVFRLAGTLGGREMVRIASNDPPHTVKAVKFAENSQLCKVFA